MALLSSDLLKENVARLQVISSECLEAPNVECSDRTGRRFRIMQRWFSGQESVDKKAWSGGGSKSTLSAPSDGLFCIVGL